MILKKAEKSYYYTKFKSASGNIQQTWKLLNKTINKKKEKATVIESLIVNDLPCTNPNDIVEKLNNYFVRIANQLASAV